MDAGVEMKVEDQVEEMMKVTDDRMLSGDKSLRCEMLWILVEMRVEDQVEDMMKEADDGKLGGDVSWRMKEETG